MVPRTDHEDRHAEPAGTHVLPGAQRSSGRCGCYDVQREAGGVCAHCEVSYCICVAIAMVLVATVLLLVTGLMCILWLCRFWTENYAKPSTEGAPVRTIDYIIDYTLLFTVLYIILYSILFI